MYSIVFITFHIGNFLSVSGFGHAICDSFRNEHVVILLDMMLRARIARMNMRAMMVIVIGSIIMMNKGKRRSARRRNKRFHRGANFMILIMIICEKFITKDNLKREHIYDEVLLDSPCANAHR